MTLWHELPQNNYRDISRSTRGKGAGKAFCHLQLGGKPEITTAANDERIELRSEAQDVARLGWSDTIL